MAATKKKYAKPVYLIDGNRTPFLKARGRPGPFKHADLGINAARPVLLRMPFAATEFDEVIFGSTMPGPDEANIARVVALRLGCGDKVPAYTVQRNCASGMQALDNAAMSISSGRSDLVLAGGIEAMSQAPLLFHPKMVHWLADWRGAKSVSQKFKVLRGFSPRLLAPVISILKGLTDPVVGLNMGQTAEQIAYRFNITRTQMDQFALESHLRLHQAQLDNELPEVVPMFDSNGKLYDLDDGVRPDSTLEKLAGLRPAFDKPYGLVTPGNSAQITDGAAALVMASEAAVKKYNLPILARLVSTEWAALSPAEMGLGPAPRALGERRPEAVGGHPSNPQPIHPPQNRPQLVKILHNMIRHDPTRPQSLLRRTLGPDCHHPHRLRRRDVMRRAIPYIHDLLRLALQLGQRVRIQLGIRL